MLGRSKIFFYFSKMKVNIFIEVLSVSNEAENAVIQCTKKLIKDNESVRVTEYFDAYTQTINKEEVITPVSTGLVFKLVNN